MIGTVTDELNEPSDRNSPTSDGSLMGGRPVRGRYPQRNLADRLFPGPSKLMSNQRTEHLEELLRPVDDGTQPNGWRGGRPRRPAAEAPNAAPSEETTPVRETLEQQNELLRAILASTIDTQTDARATAQNSRTFAWAGTAIALLTLIATVILIVTAVTA